MVGENLEGRLGHGRGQLVVPQAGQTAGGLLRRESGVGIRLKVLGYRRGSHRVPGRRRRHCRGRSAVPSHTGVAGHGDDQQAELEPRGVEEDQDVAGDRIGLHPMDAGGAGETCLKTGGVPCLTPEALNSKASPPGHGHEDDPDGWP